MRHKWVLTFEEVIPAQLTKLSPKDRIAVFRSIAELLQSDNPASVHGVKKLVEKRFVGLFRQRQGDYRILFDLQPGELERSDYSYKGKLHIVSILHRKQAYE